MPRRSDAARLAEKREEERAWFQVQERLASVSREQRRVMGATLRQWYESGTEDGQMARYNKLQSHLDRLSSYVWSPDAVRFGVHLPPAVRQAWLKAAATARDEFRQTWAISGADLAVSMALENSWIYGAVPLKVQQDADLGFIVSQIDPWDFGVTREDQGLDDQDVITHYYTLSMPQFRRWCAGHPREAELIEKAEASKRVPAGGAPMTRLVISGITGVFPGSVVTGAMPGDADLSSITLDPSVDEPVIELVDLWNRQLFTEPSVGEFEDWRVITGIAESREPLVRRRNPILPYTKLPSGTTMPAEFPFAMICPRPVSNYLWGRPEIALLTALQAWREKHTRRMDEVIQRMLDPSKFFSGFPGADFDEIGRALSSPGGSAGSSEPGAKMETIKPEMGQEPFAMLGQIDSMFADQAGLPPVTQGDQQPGVRSNSQLLTLAGIGAGRVRHMALQLEAALSRIATLGFRVLQHSDPQTYVADDGTRFILSQLPPGLSLQVSAHSSSPIFQEQVLAKAEALLKAGAIDGVWFAELVDPPYREEIKEVARKLAENRAQQQERVIQLEVEKAERKGLRGRLKSLGPAGSAA